MIGFHLSDYHVTGGLRTHPCRLCNAETNTAITTLGGSTIDCCAKCAIAIGEQASDHANEQKAEAKS